jgi:nucleoside-diphosphate-sugar epimerase
VITLVTGADGEMGRALIPALAARGAQVVALDLHGPAPGIETLCLEYVLGSIVDERAMHELFARHRFERVFHLAAVLSSKAEQDPDLAQSVNVDGTYGIFRHCLARAARDGKATRLLFPSSIAVYGLPDAATKAKQGPVRECDWLSPSGMYGCNKLYGEILGGYFATRRSGPVLDFRAIRFPGLISADTLPTGGTTDYAPEMIHAAAQGKPYACFVAESSRLPFMTMPDAVDALLALADAEPGRLARRSYNIQGFSASAGDLRAETLRHFPGAEIRFEPVAPRQAIVDSWPASLDDRPAREEWGLAPRHGLREALGDYLVPALRQRYA